MSRRVIGAFVALSVVAGGFALTSGGGSAETYTITADVTQAPSLFENGRVMVRGVKVGTITNVEPRAEGVRVTMTIDTRVKLPDDAHLSVIPITVIADRYVQIEPAYTSGATMADGDHIALENTTIPAELDDVLEQLKGLLAALEPRAGNKGPLAKLIDSLDVALAGRSEELGGTIEGGAAVLGNLAANEAQITGLISNLDKVFIALADRSSEIGLINERLALVTEALVGDQEHLEGTLENIAFLSSQAAGLVSESGDDLGTSFGRLERVLGAVLEHEDSLAEGMRWTNVIAQALGGTDASGRGLYAYSGRQDSATGPRAMYNYRIDTRDTIACERLGLFAFRYKRITPGWGLEEILDAALDHIAASYQDDLEYLVRELLVLCADPADLVGGAEPAGMDATARAIIDAIGARIGPKRLARFLEESGGAR
jgi:phospholipid/cholesterol/gamma-HCH transport system substrate-binding protein